MTHSYMLQVRLWFTGDWIALGYYVDRETPSKICVDLRRVLPHHKFRVIKVSS